MRKLAAHNAGGEESIIKDTCLIRAIPWKNGYDLTSFSECCKEHRAQHKWWIQRGMWDAILLGRFDDLVPPEQVHKLLYLVLSDLEASHICHNKPCSDPFMVEAESSAMNKGRNHCRPPLAKPCTHARRCRTELTWSIDTSWTQAKAICDAVKKDPIRPFWRCTKGCYSGNRGRAQDFFTLTHWISPGCQRGGTWVRM